MPFEIVSAILTTVYKRVFCNIIKSKPFDILTFPVILISPTSGSTLFNANPGFSGELLIKIFPTLLTDPKHASIATIYGFL